MKVSLPSVIAILGLATALPQNDPSTDGISKELEAQMQNALQELEETNKKSLPGTIQGIAEGLGWQVGGNLIGSLPPGISHGATILSLLANSDYSVTPENGKEWVKNLGGISLAFLPKVGALGGLPGFIGLIKTIAVGLETAQFPELAAKREAEARCFASNDVATYKDLCQFCKPHLTISLLGKLHGCTDERVADRDPHVDHVRAQGFCADAVLCSGYNDGGPEKIITQGFRYDPLRSFWCKEKDEQIGMLLSSWLSEPLRNSLYMLDAEDFRNALTPACKEVTKDLNIEGKCPTREEREEADKLAPPISFCAPGKQVAGSGTDTPNGTLYLA
ncbi:hypothetical protein BM221_007733 [Beauveria bassiana]|uniref:Uncharacterized protein n=1 Tax=Beauveria bassiana TaxID=176275 RepID=A0A2N6NHI4_BEABA|nr:hypothetical protein BM221_007733 [Beauveria bassiana]